MFQSKSLFSIFFSLIINFSANGQFAGGSGSEADPWQIATIAQLSAVRNYPDSCFILTTDLDFTGSSFDSANSTRGWQPIGTSAARFTGKFNGAGHTISNMYVNRTNWYIGLFGYAEGANFDSLAIINCNLSGGNYTGGLVGYCYNNVNISACYVTGTISGANYVGGLTGYLTTSSNLSNGYVQVKVTGIDYVGGLAGYNNASSTLSNCYATGSISGDEIIGGLTGRNFSASIQNSYSTCRVTGVNDVGGLVGSNSHNATVTGGFFNTETSNQSTGIGTDYFSQTVTGLTTAEMKQQAGFPGFDFTSEWIITPGETFPRIRAVYNLPILFYNLPAIAKRNSLISDTLIAVEMDGEIDSVTLEDSPEGIHIQDAILTWTPTSAGLFSFTIKVVDNNNYASSAFHTMLIHGFNGEGTVEDPFRVTGIEELDFVRNMPDKHYLLMNNLDFTGSAFDRNNSAKGWKPIGDDNNRFTGSFKGGGHTISNLFIQGNYDDQIGLFGSIEGASIDSLAIINCTISGDYDVGSLVGDCNSSTISNCYATGKVSGNVRIGGLVGSTVINSSIWNCYATASVSGNDYIGGVLGFSSVSTLSDCYATGSVSGSDYSGGLLGYNYHATVSDCYATGKVSGETNPGGLIGRNNSAATITNGYYNSETSGQSHGIGLDENSQTVAGLTSAEMKQESSFAGFDFDAVWAIRPDSTYPALIAVDNAPFAFADTLTVGASAQAAMLLANLYDYETLQLSLVAILDSVSDGYIQNNTAYLPESADEGDTVIVWYRLGELRNSDTLWGNAGHSLLVTGPNTAPVIVPDIGTLQTEEDVMLQAGLQSLASDNENDPIQFIITDSTQNGSLVIEDTTLIYTPQLNFNGMDSLRIKASDGLLTSDSVWIVISVIPVNDTPVISSVSSLTMDEDNTLTLGMQHVTAQDVDGDSLSLVVFPGDNYSLDDDQLTVIPHANYNGSLEVPVAVTDGIDTSAVVEMTIAVNAVNDRPEIHSTAPVTAIVGETWTYTVEAGDIDGDELTYSLDGAPDGMDISTNVITWIPPAGTSTSGEITLTVSDGELSDTETFTITVSGGTDIETTETESFSLYPNPTNGDFRIRFTEKQDVIGFSVSDFSGKVIAHKQFRNTNEIDYAIVGPKGLYFIQIDLGNKTTTLKISKQ
jgi:hypothetical protein